MIGAGTAIAGTVMGANAAGDAADAQRQASQDANATQLAMFNQNREDLTPWRDAGKVALGQLTKGTADGADFNRNFTLSDFTKDPGYDFRMGQGQQAMERSAAARGGALSGGAAKALERYSQDYASGEYSDAYNRFNADMDRRFNRLSSLAGTGQTATRDVASMGTSTADSIAGNQLAAGNARAAGIVGQANAVNSGVSNLQSMYSLSKMLGSGGGGAASASYPAFGAGASDSFGTLSAMA
jgi:hypothetical protein